MANELTKIEPQPLVHADEPSNEDFDLLKLAIREGKVDVMERVMVVRRELRAEKAKELFDEAMTKFQRVCPVIEKTKAGPKSAYFYAPLDAIVSKTRELIADHGFSYTISGKFENGYVTAVVTVKHNMGHSETSEFRSPVDQKNPMMTEPQRYGGAMTFAKRYAFCNAFGILTGDEDNDAQAIPEPPQGPRTQAPAKTALPPDAVLKRRLFDLTRKIHGVVGYSATPEQINLIENHLFERGIMSADETLAQIKGDRLAEVVAKLEGK